MKYDNEKNPMNTRTNIKQKCVPVRGINLWKSSNDELMPGCS